MKKKEEEFLICPVREADKELTERIEKYVEMREKKGFKVYYPRRDTNQIDPVGLKICTDNALAIIPKKEIKVWRNKNSQGSLFDLGMGFVLSVLFSKERSLFWRIKTITKLFFMGEKIITLANSDEVKPTEGKSFENFLLALHSKNTKGEKK